MRSSNKVYLVRCFRKSEAGGKTSSGDDCRVCRKSFGPEEVSRTCCECQHKVCEDCASYSTTTNSDDPSSWRCSVCRRKIASRDQPIVTQESTDSLLDVPCLEALHRRHSDARLGPTGSQIGGLGSGLAPPRSPEIRRHSDVSPASLKELEKFRKVTGERQREDLRWERDLDRKSKSRGGSPDRHQASDIGRATSPQRVVMPAQTGAIEQEGGDLDDEEERRRRARRGGGTIRRKSRVTRQRSYDDEIKTAATMATGGAQPTHPDTGLGLPVQLPRRASAYDVYAVPGSSGLNAMAIAAAQQRTSISAQGTREPEERPARRSSFRAVKPVMPYDAADDEKMIKLDSSSAPAVVSPASQPVLIPDEERRNRRRGSQLPDINAIRALTSAQPGAVKGGPAVAVSRVAAEERELPRQGSLVDGEGIKIVIHDVDSDPAPRINAKRRVKLRHPVTDKGHRTRGFGMKVVGGKIGSDGRTFAYILWTVSGGPAEKAGLQQGDKVLEWCGVSLIDRSFEEIQQIIEQTDDVVDLVVEHSTEITGDMLDDPQAGKSPTNLGLLMGKYRQ
ncbi:Protein piccolo [Cyphomyrmex costatus]|uniref:Protein piccolo n=1 Tax=Cyphomyrmex costatus TaxID=456900 RepID=A0A151INI8_9HYME|nr:Protein piccolo [Cyphomyrmex costatus]